MEKLIYLAWKPVADTGEMFRNQLCQQVAPALLAAGARHLRVTVADSAVEAARKLRITSAAPGSCAPDATISFWLDSTRDRDPLELAMRRGCNRINGYLVTESEPLRNTQHIMRPGERTPGMNQVVLLRKPERLTREQWLDTWLNSHTQIALDTQSTFGYRQNIIVRALTPDTAPIDAIVEENFPHEAMTSGHAFYNAVGNDRLYKENREKMFVSVQRFIDFDKLDCLPMSEYNF